MSTEAVAEALAPAQEPVKVEIVEAPEFDEASAMDDIWSRSQDEASADQPPESEEDAEKAAPEAEAGKKDDPAENVEKSEEEESPAPDDAARQEKVEGPSELPRAVRDAWGEIPDAAREAVLSSHREMGRKLAEQGKQMQGIAPIRDGLVELARELPEMQNMTADQVLKEFRIFRDDVVAPLTKDPMGTIIKFAQERGISEQLRAALGGEQAQGGQEFQRMAQIIRSQQQAMEQLQQQVQGIAQQPILKTVDEFARGADHWDEVVETILPAISYVQSAFPELSDKDTLQKAYDMEIQRIGKVQPSPSREERAAPDPERTEQALKAKSVNVTGKPTNAKPLSVEQMDDKIWRKHHS